MKTGVGLAFICVGAILAFAVTTNTSVFNLHTAGWVIMLVGVIGLLTPRRTYGWLGRRLVRRTYPVSQVEEVSVPGYVTREPGTARIRAGLPARRPWPVTRAAARPATRGRSRRFPALPSSSPGPPCARRLPSRPK